MRPLSAYLKKTALWFDDLTTNGENPFALSLSKGRDLPVT